MKEMAKVVKYSANFKRIGTLEFEGVPGSIGDLFSISNLLKTYLGLSEYESRIYTAILLRGSLTAGKIAIYSGVPRVKVYSCLKRLMEAGLVYEEPGRPARYRTFDSAPTLRFIADKLEGEAMLLKRLSNMVRRVEEGRNYSDVWVFDDIKGFVSKIQELMFEVKRCLSIVVSPDGLALLYRKLSKSLEFVARKGIRVEVYGRSGGWATTALRELSYVYKVREAMVPENVFAFAIDYESCVLGFVKVKVRSFEVGPLILLRGRKTVKTLWRVLTGVLF
ncbi:TrmB family transcriptional regulator [Candidatus Bathyarchaeota archaeon]|nr:TrmB family transcriptional regulator [Candidatus Bathyarchaeota archaeon]